MINLEPEVSVPPTAAEAEKPADRPPDEFVDQKLDSVPPVHPWHLTYYNSYFDVSTFTVLLRLKKAIYPFAPNDFFEGATPDLYCPIWICFTLVFVFSAGGNLVTYEDAVEDREWIDGLTNITVAIFLFFGLLFAIPLACRFLLWRVNAKPSLVELLSLYGYSLVLYLPAGFICLLPITWGRWMALTIAAAWSSALMFKNYRREFEGTGGKKRWILAAMVVAGHVGIILAGGLFFFR